MNKLLTETERAEINKRINQLISWWLVAVATLLTSGLALKWWVDV